MGVPLSEFGQEKIGAGAMASGRNGAMLPQRGGPADCPAWPADSAARRSRRRTRARDAFGAVVDDASIPEICPV